MCYLFLLFQVHSVSSSADSLLFNATLSYDRTQYCSSEGEAAGGETVGRPGGSNEDGSLQENEEDTVNEIDGFVQETPADAALSTHPTSPSFSSPLPSSTSTCEALQQIARSSDRCQMHPNTCHTLECNAAEDDSYRISVTILPCGETPGVTIAVDHLLEESTLLHKVYTKSSQEPVYLGGSTQLFDMVVSIKQSVNMDHITLMVIATCKLIGSKLFLPSF